MTTSRVALIRCDTYENDSVFEAVSKAVTLLGGIESFIQAQEALPGLTNSGATAIGIRMSPGEVYVHELVHHITAAGLRDDKVIRRQVEILREEGAPMDRVCIGHAAVLVDLHQVPTGTLRIDSRSRVP